MPDSREIERKLADTQPAKVREMETEKIIEHEQYFSEQLPLIAANMLVQHYREPWQARMDSLRREIQHRELYGIGKKTLTGTEKTVFWARLAVLAAVIVPVGLYLISELYSSNTRRARRKKASSQTYLQTPASTAGSPAPEASSNSAIASPEQAPTAQPSVSPPES